LKKIITSYSISDEATKSVIQQVFDRKQYLLDPHGAVGYISLKEYLRNQENDRGIFLETAHPVKFHDAIEPLIGISIPLPLSVEELKFKQKNSIKIDTSYSKLKELLLSNALRELPVQGAGG